MLAEKVVRRALNRVMIVQTENIVIMENGDIVVIVHPEHTIQASAIINAWPMSPWKLVQTENT